jgi:hypothetical protein
MHGKNTEKEKQSHDHKHTTFCRQCKGQYHMYLPSHVKNTIKGDHVLKKEICTEMSDKDITKFLQRICEDCYNTNQ